MQFFQNVLKSAYISTSFDTLTDWLTSNIFGTLFSLFHTLAPINDVPITALYFIARLILPRRIWHSESPTALGQILFQINMMNEQRQEGCLEWKMVGYDGRSVVKTVKVGFDRRLGDKTVDWWLRWWTGAKKRTGGWRRLVAETEDWWLRCRTGTKKTTGGWRRLVAETEDGWLIWRNRTKKRKKMVAEDDWWLKRRTGG
jgi:hypothetical protein